MHTRIDISQKTRRNLPLRVLVDPASAQKRNSLDPIQLLEVAAHDLRNPLSGILAASQYLLEDARSVLAEHHIAMLGSIDAAGRSMLRLIDDMMELSEIESGRLRLDVKATALQPLLARALLSGREVADAKNVQLEMRAGDRAAIPPLDIDSEKVLRALEGLVASAVVLTGPGGKILVAVESRTGRANISVRVNGSGISSAALRSLFNPFRKGRIVRSSVEAGTAIALAKVTRIVEAHGGLIRVEGNAETELIVRLTLPLPNRTPVNRSAAGAA